MAIKKRPRQRREAVLEELFEEEFEFVTHENKKQKLADEALEAFQAAPFKDKLELRYKWRQALIRAWYGEIDPKEIPTEDLRIISNYSSDFFMDTKYAEKIKSPVTAVRAFCFNCQGGTVSFIRNCTNSNCVLFPFRMGSNPFYGRIADADAEVTEEFPEEDQVDADNQA